MKPRQSIITIKNTHYRQELYKLAPDLYHACKSLIIHRRQGDVHPIDYQRIRQILEKMEAE